MSVGTWRPFLDEVILKGSRGYALRMMAIKAEHQAKTDLGTSRTRLGSIAAIHTLVGTALTRIVTNITAAGTALAKVDLHTTTHADADLAGMDAQVTAVGTALTNAVTELGKVNADLIAAEGVWTSEVTRIDGSGGVVGAGPYLQAGDAFINVVNLGKDVAELYSVYAQRETDIAILYDRKRAHFLEEAARHADTMNGYIAEASQRIGLTQSMVASANAEVSIARALVEEAAGRLGMAQEDAREAQYRIEDMRTYVMEAERYELLATREMELADRYRAESDRVLKEFQEVLNDRAQYRTNLTNVSGRQPR